MTPQLIEKIRKDFEAEPDKSTLCWESYMRGHAAGLKRFSERKRRKYPEIKPMTGYSRIGLGNV